MTLKVLDMFSGIGGFSLGLERTGGFKTIAFCEIEEFPRKVLKKHWPDVPIFEDVRKLHAEDIDGTVDVICGGFPCQDLSCAGRQKGFEGERSSLYVEMLRLISECRPKYAIFENVTALLTGANGKWFSQFLFDLAEVGYDAEWHCIPASSVGAPHERDRVWIIAYPNSIRLETCWVSKGGKKIYSSWASIKDNSFDARGWLRNSASRTHRAGTRVPFRMDRLKCLGNAVVPQIPELIGRAILEACK